jgi:hypothetical protein
VTFAPAIAHVRKQLDELRSCMSEDPVNYPVVIEYVQAYLCQCRRHILLSVYFLDRAAIFGTDAPMGIACELSEPIEAFDADAFVEAVCRAEVLH